MKYFHLSEQYHGKLFTFSPRVPRWAVDSHEDVTTRRVCFCPSVIQCLYAIHGHEIIDKFGNIDLAALREAYRYEDTNLSIYSVDGTLLTPAGRVPDKHTSGEMWSRKPIFAKFEGYLDVGCFVKLGIVKTTRKAVRGIWKKPQWKD